MNEHPTPNQPKRRRGIIAGATLAAMLAGGGLSVAAAAQGSPQQTPTTKQDTGQQDNGQQDNGQEQGEKPDATYQSSITSPEAPEGKDGSGTDEAAQKRAEAAALAKLATVTPAQAAEAATKAVPGKAATPELSNEDGNVVYDVTVTSTDAKTQTDVIIDAGNAKVLAQATENAENESNQAPEKGEPATNEAPSPTTGATPGN